MQVPPIFKQTGLRKAIEMANKITLNLFLITQYCQPDGGAVSGDVSGRRFQFNPAFFKQPRPQATGGA